MSGLLFNHSPALWRSTPGVRRMRLVYEERANQITHGVAAALSVAGAIGLMSAARQTGDPWLMAGCAVFGVSMSLVYWASCLSHSFLSGRWKHRFRTLDQVSIFLLIAGNYTPVGLTLCRDNGWWLVLAAMWLLSLGGIGIKLFVTRLQNVPAWFYAAVGWLPGLTIGHLAQQLPLPAMLWILAGGGLYSVGIYFLTNDRKVWFYHPVWHVLTMSGTACHFLVVYWYVVPA